MRRAKLAAITAVVALSACTRISTSAQPPATHRGTIPGVARVAIRGDITTLNPVLMGIYSENYISEAIFNGLVKLDDRGDVLPDLITRVPSRANGDISDDGKTITYHLRRGVTWQDGAPLSAADVKFTYAITTNPKTNSPGQAQYAAIRSVDTPDAFTIVVRLREPFAPVFTQLFCAGGNGGIVPKHLLERSADFNTDPFARRPVGSGPFEVERWQPGSILVLKPNPHYFGGKPRLNEIDIRFVADTNTAAAMVASREIDLTGISKDQIPGVRGATGVRILEIPSASLDWIQFNVRHAPFSDVRVRQALTLALDRHRIVSNALRDTAVPAESLIPPANWAYAADNGSPRYDPARAKQLLAEAGWAPGPDGTLRKNGRSFEFALDTLAGSTIIASMALQAQAAWRAIGVNAVIRPLPPNLLYGLTGPLTTGNFDVEMSGFGFDVDPDRANTLESRYFPPRGQNSSRYSDPQMDAWLEAARHTYDRRERARLYALVQRKANEDLPIIPLAWLKYVYAVNVDLHGLRPETINSDFWNVQDWSI